MKVRIFLGLLALCFCTYVHGWFPDFTAVRASAIGEHCGSYSEWWLDVAPLASSSGAGDSSVRRELVVAATTTFNYTQVRIYSSEGLMVDLVPFYTQTCYSFLISRCDVALLPTSRSVSWFAVAKAFSCMAGSPDQ